MGIKTSRVALKLLILMVLLAALRLAPARGASGPEPSVADNSPSPGQKIDQQLYEMVAVWKVKDVIPSPSCYRKSNAQGQQLGGNQSFDILTGFEALPKDWQPGELVIKIGYQFPGQAAPVWKFPEYHLSDEISSKPIGYMGALADPTIVVNYDSRNYIGFVKQKFLIPRAQMNGEGKIIVSIETRTKKNVYKEEKSKALKACPIY